MKDFLDDNFFVISTENCNDVQPRMYGYVILDNKILINSHSCNYRFPNECFGCYVNVTKDSDIIRIDQDYFGCYGLYLYQTDNYFAVSNSFLYLVNYLKTRVPLSFSTSYARAFISQATSQLTDCDTMVKEIRLLPKNVFVCINNDKSLQIGIIEQKEDYIDIDTQEAMALIDDWHSKWNKSCTAILNNYKKLICDLSGGKDSRIALSVLLSPKLDFDNIRVSSSTDGVYTHGEDYEIASILGKKCNFSLNKNLPNDKFKMDPVENLNLSFFAKCGFHKELLCTIDYNKQTQFRIMGFGGESLREHWNIPVDDFIQHEVQNNVFNSIDCNTELNELINKTVDQIAKIDNTKILENLYKYVRLREHCGRAMVELFLANTVILTPLMDPVLHKLNQNLDRVYDKDLLWAIIIDRFMPEVSDVKFDSHKAISEQSWSMARKLNQKYPFVNNVEEREHNNFSVVNERNFMPMKSNSPEMPKSYLIRYFESEDLKKVVVRLFGLEIYNKTISYFKTKAYQPTIPIAALVEIYIIWKATQTSRQIDNYSLVDIFTLPEKINFQFENYRNNAFLKKLFAFISSARIDIKNINIETNDITILSSTDKNLFVEKPKWNSDKNGIGYVLQSSKEKIILGLECVNSGKLRISFKGPYMKNSNNEVLSIKIDYTQIQILDSDTQDIVKEIANISVDHNQPYIVEIPCKDKQKFVIKADWLPYVYEEDELIKLIHDLYDKRLAAFTFWEKAKS